jgi:bacterioferritin
MKLASSGLEAGLHKMVADKQASIATLQAHHSLQRAWGYHRLSKQTKGRVDEERDHLKSTLHYMTQREVIPKMDRAPLAIGTDVISQLTNELTCEKNMANDLNDLLSAARTANEDSLRRMIEHCVKDDEQHIADLERQLNLIKTMGLQNYLAKASKV